MEWVETTAKTVEEAKELALDQLGVHEEDAEFEVIEEPRPGLFGRTRGEARVRARVRPTRPRPKMERRDRRGKSATKSAKGNDVPAASGNSAGDAGGANRQSRPAGTRSPKQSAGTSSSQSRVSKKTEGAVMDSSDQPSVEEVAAAADRFVQGLLDALELTGTTAIRHDGDDIEVDLDGENLGLLIGPRGTTLLAVQDLVRVASQRRTGDHQTRLRIDICGYREKRRAALERFALAQADEALASGEERFLEPMPSSDRKVIHDALAARTDVTTRSEGEEPKRRIVIAPAQSAS